MVDFSREDNVMYEKLNEEYEIVINRYEFHKRRMEEAVACLEGIAHDMKSLIKKYGPVE